MKSIALLGLVLTTFNLSAATLYVSLESTNPVAPFATWATAATNIQDAVDAAKDGDTVLVTNGVYATGGRAVGTSILVNRVAVERPLTLRSVNGPKDTVIQGAKDPVAENGLGGGAVRCVYLSDGASLSGFTLTNGATSYRTVDGTGGGVWCVSTNSVVANSVFVGNSADIGGGVIGGTLHDCTLKDNWANEAGGAFGTTLNNCTVSANRSSYYAGGVSASVLHNCTVRNNVGSLGGGPSAAFSTTVY